MLDSMSPALFASANYVAAVRTDGTVINASSAAKPGDVLELYGTGFGPTSPAVAAGVVYQGAAPTATAVTVTMGGVTAPVSFAGLVGAGLYQLNVTVPSLPNGDYPVVAQAGSLSTQPGVLIKVQT